jgi:hypothetical protein
LAVVATAQSRTWWTVALAVEGLIVAAYLTAASMRRLLAEEDLTTAEQQRVADLAGGDQTYRDALSATQPSLGGIRSEGALHALALHVLIRDGAADVSASPTGRDRSASFSYGRRPRKEPCSSPVGGMAHRARSHRSAPPLTAQRRRSS